MVTVKELTGFMQRNVLAPCAVGLRETAQLSGLGGELDEGDRVLVMGQQRPSQNGIYLASAGTWERARDSARMISGAIVNVLNGDNEGIYEAEFVGGYEVGKTDLTFSLFPGFGQASEASDPAPAEAVIEALEEVQVKLQAAPLSNLSPPVVVEVSEPEAVPELRDEPPEEIVESDDDYDVADLLKENETRESGLVRWTTARARLAALEERTPQVISELSKADEAIRRLTKGTVEIVG